MPARHTYPVRMLPDPTAVPPRDREALTGCDHAFAFLIDATYDPAMPNHALPGSVLTASWWVIERGAPVDRVPVLVTYERGRGFTVQGLDQPYRHLGWAMDAAVGAA